MQKFSITKFVPQILKENPGERLTAREIANRIYEHYPEACEDKQRRSRAKDQPLDTHAGLINAICSEISSQKVNLERLHNVKTIEVNPREFFYSTSSDTADVLEAESAGQNAPFIIEPIKSGSTCAPKKLTEADLYPMLAEYVLAELNVLTKRIDERRSKNSRGKEGNMWLHPDLVGMEPLTTGWDPSIIRCVEAVGDTRSKLYSFEAKILVNQSNVRQSFFQAVSNSSWANYAYLVAGGIEGATTMSELRVLSGTHGVGFIRLDATDPSKSEIMIPARERPSVDWNSANRLAAENPDFVYFLKLVRSFHQDSDLPKLTWDYAGETD